MPTPQHCDVLIIGAGMAGACLARQLRLRLPELKIVVLEKKESFDYWVGESTVEAWEDYMTRVLDLGPYLERHHLHKHGLRFFFDTPEKDLPLAEMSEYGRAHLHPIAARQIDRARFDADLCEMNRALGIEVLTGVKVQAPAKGAEAITLDRDNGHRVHTSAGEFHCRWLVDAGGRNSPLVRKLDLMEPEEDFLKGSYWGRYKGCNVIDQLGSDEWRRRVNYTQRFHSTCHFMYPGYWIWHITVDQDVVSIGVEFDERRVPLKIRNGEELTAWLREHACMREILGDKAELLDFMGLKRISYRARQFFSTDRWFLTGMSGLFVNVLGSSTSRLYSSANMLIEEMIRTDIKGEQDALERETRHFNLHMRTAYESGVRFLDNMERNGSFDVWGPFFGASLALYFNSLLPSATNDFDVEIATARAHGADCGCGPDTNRTIQLRFKIAHLADEFLEFLKARGQFYARNRGEFDTSDDWEERPDIAAKIYKPRDLEEEQRIATDVYRELCRRYVRRMAEIEGIAFDEAAFDATWNPDWMAGQSLEDMLAPMRRPVAAAANGHGTFVNGSGTTETPEAWFHRRATHYVEAQVLFHLNQAGVLEDLRHHGAATPAEIAGRLGLETKATETLLDYVYEVDDLLARDGDGRYALSDFGERVFARFSGANPKANARLNMFDVRVGCFGPVWSNLGGMLSGEMRYGEDFHRDGSFAEAGVYKLSQKFWPTLHGLLDELKIDRAMEVGLTTGLLERIGIERPEIALYGLDRNEQTLELAASRAAAAEVTDVHWLQGDVFDPASWTPEIGDGGKGLLYSLHFHEFLAGGEEALTGLLRDLRERFPGWYVAAFEQPRLPHEDRAKLSEQHWLYAQSNVLIHHLIGNGRILPAEDWRRLGEEAGCRLVTDRPCDYLGYRAFVFQL